MSSDEKWMERALKLASRGQGKVEPNPMVGAVLVRDGQKLAEGYHRKYGQAHAEVDALENARKAGVDPAGATLYVTLEPCCHFGKTPPCTQAIISAGVRKVVTAMVDPSPHAAGKGIAQLRDAGIEVVTGVLEEQASDVLAPFIKRVTTKLPWVIAKWAQTLDGRIAAHTGDSQYISGEASRNLVHEIRARVDAIVVGVGTAAQDDPLLTARNVKVLRQAVRVVIDPHLRLPVQSKLVKSLKESKAPPVLLAVAHETLDSRAMLVTELQEAGVQIWPLDALAGGAPGLLNLEPLMKHLAQTFGATNVLVEGGSRTLGTLLRQGLVDEILAFVAPKLLGDARALPAVKGLEADRIADALTLKLRGMQVIDQDVLLNYLVPR